MEVFVLFRFFSPSQSVTCDKYQGSGLNMGGLLGSLTVLQEVQYRVQTAVSPQQQRVQVSGSGPELNRVLSKAHSTFYFI